MRKIGTGDGEKVRAVVARRAFSSQHVESTPFSDHFWKLRRRKSARRCGAKHIFKSKVQKTGDVEKVRAVVARSTFPSQKCKKLTGWDHFLTFRCRKARTD